MDTNNVKASADSVSTGLSNFMCIIYIFKANSSILFQPYSKTSNTTFNLEYKLKKKIYLYSRLKVTNRRTDLLFFKVLQR